MRVYASSENDPVGLRARERMFAGGSGKASRPIRLAADPSDSSSSRRNPGAQTRNLSHSASHHAEEANDARLSIDGGSRKT